MKARLTVAVSTLAVIACAVLMLPLVPACARLGPCVAQAVHGEDWSAVVRTIMLLVGGGTLSAWLLRTLFLVFRTDRLVRELPKQDCPPDLREAVARTGGSRAVCIASDRPLAFCAGILDPQIYLSRGLVEQLRPAELDAVLLHELHHCRRRDPFRYAVAVALKDICFYLPVLGWLAQYLRENAELRADRAAIVGAGRPPLAGALWALGSAAGAPAIAAFAGAAELRVAQVLGDPLPRRRPERSLVLASGVGILSLVATVTCLVQSFVLH